MDPTRASSDWTDATIARLRQLWAEGHATAEIGRRLGVSKNAVVGKAHRLHLPSRPSPIRKDQASALRRKGPRPPVPKLADIMPISGAATMPLLPVKTAQRASPLPRHERIERAAAPTSERRRRSELPVLTGRNSPCCWPIGEPGTQGFRFCEATSLPGRPYCDEHAGIAYVRPRDRRERQAGREAITD